MSKLAKSQQLAKAAAAVGIDPKTARKYRNMNCLPSQIDKQPRSYRTRIDPFQAVWPEIERWLTDASELEAKTVFDELCERFPGTFHEGQLRSLQRRIKRWRAINGPAREVFFPQDHRPGEALQTDFTWCHELQITIAGQPFAHMLCHSVLPYSNWEHATVCRSESLAAIKRGLQETLRVLGYVPKFHQTDNSTAATHNLSTGMRCFINDYLVIMEHYGLNPRTIAIGKKEQNGDVESSHGVLKRRLKQHLLLRRSNDFDSVADYEQWLYKILEKANRQRLKRLREELNEMRPLVVAPLPEYKELRVKVSRYSTILVQRNVYSVPSQLRGEELLVRVYDDCLEVFLASHRVDRIERLLGERKHRINYRHVIDSLLKKPGAFARYRYREDMFPRLSFRQAYDRLIEKFGEQRGTLQYLQILKLAARTMESEVETALTLLLEQGLVPSCDEVKSLLESERQAPTLAAPTPDLTSYDKLYEQLAELKEAV